MAINPNNGVLDIINGTLKVSSIDIKQAAGFTTTLNTVARNDVLLFDDQKASTVFTPTSEGGYMSSTGVTRDTTEGAGYIDLNDGWVYWPIQLPNSWHTEFDMHVTTTGGVLTFSLFNTSEPNHTDYTNNDGGYKIVFDNTTNKLILYYEGSPHKLGDVNIRSPDWQHVNINYFQGAISVSLAGKVVLTHEFTQNYQEFNSRYVGFSATTGASHKIRHLRVHNSDKWLYTKTSNASDITYVSGNVGIGTLTPTELLDVHGNVHIAKDLTVNGNLTVSGTTTFIDTQNLAIEDPIIEVARGNASDTIDAGLVITRATSNVAVAYRGDEEELALGYTQSGASDTDVTPITDGGLDVRVYGNLFANNLTTTANVEATYLKGNGSEITHVTLDQVVDYGNTTANTIHLTNTDVGLKADGNVDASYFIGNGSKLTGLVTDLQSVTDNGNVTSNTVQFTNATTAFVADSNVGIGTDTPAANLHVVGYQYVNDPPTIANSFDHSDAPLTLTHGTPTSTTAVDDPKAVLHLTRDGTDGESYGSKASFKMSRYENSGTASRSRLDVALTDGTYTESTVMTLRADGKVGIGTTAPGYTLDVRGTANVGALTATSISGPLSGNADTATSLETARTIGGESFDGTANIDLPGVNTAGTQNTSGNADTATTATNQSGGTVSATTGTFSGNVGIGTNNPALDLHVMGGIMTQNNGTLTPQIQFKSGSNNTNGWLVRANISDTFAGDFTIDRQDNSATPSKFVIKNSGNVGIGTTSPTSKLELAANGGGSIITLKRTNTSNGGAKGGIRFTENTNGYNVGTIACLGDGANTSGALCFYTKASSTDTGIYLPTTDERMRITSTGNVGIGTTGPTETLDVNGSVRQRGANTYLDWTPRRIIMNYDSTYRQGIQFSTGTREMTLFSTTGDSGGSIIFKTRAGGGSSDTDYGTERMRITGGGLVGIGTNSPATALDVAGSFRVNGGYTSTFGNDGLLHINSRSTTHGSETVALQTTIDGRALTAANPGTYGGESRNVLALQPDGGYVGIGTPSPGFKLHVVGTSYFTNTINIQPSSTGGGQNLFTGYRTGDSYGRARLVLSSGYSDVIIASSQANNNHGSNLSFVTYNPSNAADYRKFVINQGNWGSRKQFLDFGYADKIDPNPHGYINGTDTVLTLDGINKRVGINNINPSYNLDVNGNARINRLHPYSSSYSSAYNTAAIEVREYNMEGSVGGTYWARAPRIGFHWSGRVASQILCESSGQISVVDNPGNNYENFKAKQVSASTAFYAPGHPVQYVGQNVHDIVVYGNSIGRYITPLDITITPKFSNSKIMLHWVINAEAHHDQVIRIYRFISSGASSLIGFNSNNQGVHSGAAPILYDTDHNSTLNTHTVAWVDTPNTTSAVTYRIFTRPSNNGSNWFRLNRTVGGGTLGQANHEIAVSYKSAMEIAV